MATYDDVVRMAEESLVNLQSNLKEIDALKKRVNSLLQKPEQASILKDDIVKLTKVYGESFGAVSKDYLSSASEIVRSGLEKLDVRMIELKEQVKKLEQLNLRSEFNDKAKEFFKESQRALSVPLQGLNTGVELLDLSVQRFTESIRRFEGVDVPELLNKTLEAIDAINAQMNKTEKSLEGILRSAERIEKGQIDIQAIIKSEKKTLAAVLNESIEVLRGHLRSDLKQIEEHNEQSAKKLTANLHNVKSEIAQGLDGKLANLSRIIRDSQTSTEEAVGFIQNEMANIAAVQLNLRRQQRLLTIGVVAIGAITLISLLKQFGLF